MRALLSVYDKSGLVDFARGLSDLGWQLVASGGTSKALNEAGIEHRQVDEITGAPEMLGGRVKTLHPAIHGGILADRSVDSHMADIASQGIEAIDLVVCNLYPFTSDPSIELIDVGGPTMVRAAAKNHAHVGVVVRPSDYSPVLEELRSNASLSDMTRRSLARAAFAHTAAYDAAIVDWFVGDQPATTTGSESKGEDLPDQIVLSLQRADELRYGENPHQRGARYRESGAVGWWDSAKQHSGIPLSYLNIFDADAAWRLVHSLGETPAAAIIKHANPCGLAVHEDIGEAYRRAFEADPVSAFGGVVALNRPIDTSLAEEMVANPKADVLIAPGYSEQSLELLATKKKNLRVLEAKPPQPKRFDLRRIDGGFLVQGPDSVNTDPSTWKVVTTAQPTEEQWRDAQLAWVLCASVSSNAIVIVDNGQAVGIGAGQQNRVDSVRIAARKAGEKAKGAVLASDAFFPFSDGVESAVECGVSVVIQPGGSVRDEEVIAAAEHSGIAMVLTGERHFKH